MDFRDDESEPSNFPRLPPLVTPLSAKSARSQIPSSRRELLSSATRASRAEKPEMPREQKTAASAPQGRSRIGTATERRFEVQLSSVVSALPRKFALVDGTTPEAFDMAAAFFPAEPNAHVSDPPV
jgi:hypothetical protein